MPVFKGASLELSLGPFMHPLVFDSVDTSQYQGVPGDAITVRPSHNAELAHVLVTVRARRSGLIERGSAVWHPESGTWRFVAKAHFPRGEGLLVDVMAVAAPGHHSATLSSIEELRCLTVECRSAGELHVAGVRVKPRVRGRKSPAVRPCFTRFRDAA
ncbi:MAG: hypothetical protein AB9869_09345 [Verrucomicrobiia bacterium]